MVPEVGYLAQVVDPVQIPTSPLQMVPALLFGVTLEAPNTGSEALPLIHSCGVLVEGF